MPSADDLKQSMGAKLVQMGDNYYQLGQLDKAIDYYRQAMSFAQQSAEPAMQRSLLMRLSLSTLRLGVFDSAREYYDQASHITVPAAAMPDAVGQLAEISLLLELGKAYYQRGDYANACSYLEGAAAYVHELDALDERIRERLEYQALTLTALTMGDLAQIADTCRASMNYAEAANDDGLMGLSLVGLGLAEILTGQPSAGLAVLERAEAKLYASQDEMLAVEAKAYHCLSLIEAGRSEEALDQALTLLDAQRDALSMRAHCVVLAALALGQALIGQSASLATSQQSQSASLELFNRGDPIGFRLAARSLIGLGLANEGLSVADEALAAYREALAMSEDVPDTSVRLRALLGIAAATLPYDPEEARLMYRQARAAAQEVGSLASEALALNGLGQVEAAQGNPDAALALFQRALESAGKSGDQWARCRIHLAFSAAYRTAGKLNPAAEQAQQALECARTLRSGLLEGQAHGCLGLALVDTGDVGRAVLAEQHLSRALELARQMGDRSQQQSYRGGLGAAYAMLGEVQKAVDQYAQALAEARDLGDRRSEVTWLANIANLYVYLGQTRRAVEPYQQAIQISEQLGDQETQANLLVSLGLAYSDLDQLRESLAAVRSARALYVALGNTNAVSRIDNLLAQLG